MSSIKTEYIVNSNGTTSIRLRYNGGRYTDIDGKVKQHRPSRVLDILLPLFMSSLIKSMFSFAITRLTVFGSLLGFEVLLG
tara:strand:+ start:90 stop:332 length:243 start_codon:yes stop_codon:yes gene_type:complete